jgi:hypothetical protein
MAVILAYLLLLSAVSLFQLNILQDTCMGMIITVISPLVVHKKNGYTFFSNQ